VPGGALLRARRGAVPEQERRGCLRVQRPRRGVALVERERACGEVERRALGREVVLRERRARLGEEARDPLGRGAAAEQEAEPSGDAGPGAGAHDGERERARRDPRDRPAAVPEPGGLRGDHLRRRHAIAERHRRFGHHRGRVLALEQVGERRRRSDRDPALAGVARDVLVAEELALLQHVGDLLFREWAEHTPRAAADLVAGGAGAEERRPGLLRRTGEGESVSGDPRVPRRARARLVAEERLEVVARRGRGRRGRPERRRARNGRRRGGERIIGRRGDERGGPRRRGELDLAERHGRPRRSGIGERILELRLGRWKRDRRIALERGRGRLGRERLVRGVERGSLGGVER
jgi:hypothetical protein